MIQLATDPAASRMKWRPEQAKGDALQARQGKPGHAWPFIVRNADKPAAQGPARKPSADHGS